MLTHTSEIGSPEGATAPTVEMRGITVSFPGVLALDDVSFRLFPGEVHALLGENGAGKSTLIKALTGVNRIVSGEILLRGEPNRDPQSGAGPDGGDLHRVPGSQPGGQPVGRREHDARPGAPTVRPDQLAADAPPRGGRARTAAPRHRPCLAARVALDRRPATRVDRPRRRGRRPGADPRRADVESRHAGGRRAVRGRRAGPCIGCRRAVRHPLPRPGVPPRRPHHRAAQRSPRRRVPHPGAAPPATRLQDDRSRARRARSARARGA